MKFNFFISIILAITFLNTLPAAARDSTTVSKKEQQRLLFTLTDIDLPEKQRIIAGKKLLALGEKAAPIIPDLIVALQDNQGHYEYPERILAAIGEKAVPQLITVLEDDHPRHWRLRRRACYILGLMGKKAKEAMPALIKATGDENRGVREDAVYALGYIGRSGGKPEIIKVIKKMVCDEKPGVRRAAVRSLFRASVKPVPDDIIDTLAGALDDEHWSVRKAAAQALGHSGDRAKSKVPLLRKLLKDPEERVSKAAGDAIRMIGN